MQAGGGSGKVQHLTVSLSAGSVLRLESEQEENKFSLSVTSVSGGEDTLLLNSTAGQDGDGYHIKRGLTCEIIYDVLLQIN